MAVTTDETHVPEYLNNCNHMPESRRRPSAAVVQFISDVYFDPGLGYVSKRLIAQRIREKNATLPENAQVAVSASDIEWFFAHEGIIQRFLPQKKKLVLAPVTAFNPFVIWEADLIDYSKLRDRTHDFFFILVVIDDFTKFVWAQPLKTKTSKEIIRAYMKILARANRGIPKAAHRAPINLITDQEAAIKGHDFQDMLTGQHTRWVNYEQKAASVESVIRTLKNRFERFFVHSSSQDWPSILDEVVSNYNTTLHSFIETTPMAMQDAARACLILADRIAVLQVRCGQPTSSQPNLRQQKCRDEIQTGSEELIETKRELAAVQQLMKLKRARIWRTIDGRTSGLQVGDSVRRLIKGNFRKGSKSKWSKEVFEVVRAEGNTCWVQQQPLDANERLVGLQAHLLLKIPPGTQTTILPETARRAAQDVRNSLRGARVLIPQEAWPDYDGPFPGIVDSELPRNKSAVYVRFDGSTQDRYAMAADYVRNHLSPPGDRRGRGQAVDPRDALLGRHVVIPGTAYPDDPGSEYPGSVDRKQARNRKGVFVLFDPDPDGRVTEALFDADYIAKLLRIKLNWAQ